jgi:hypothetical protein
MNRENSENSKTKVPVKIYSYYLFKKKKNSTVQYSPESWYSVSCIIHLIYPLQGELS